MTTERELLAQLISLENDARRATALSKVASQVARNTGLPKDIQDAEKIKRVAERIDSEIQTLRNRIKQLGKT